MKKHIPLGLKKLLYSFALLLLCTSGVRASHIVGADLYYQWQSGLTYKITVVLYGDCGPASSSAFGQLPSSAPQVCIFDGATSVASVTCNIVAPNAGVEITPVCPDSLAYTQCTNNSYFIPGIKKFVYSTTYTFPYRSHKWRLLYLGYNGPSSAAAGRAAAITNISSPPTMQLTDSLDNFYHDNTSPQLTIGPTPFFPNLTPDNYNPGAVDPDNDSLMFFLTDAQSGSGSTSCTSLGLVTYTGTAWPGQPITAQYPVQCAPGMWNLNPYTGQITFTPNALQRSVVVYNIREYRNDTFMGTCQREMTFLTKTSSAIPPTAGTPTASGATIDDATHFHVCQETGPFTITLHPTIPDPTKHITVTSTGLTGTGISFTVLGNGTNTPTVNISGNTSSLAAGDYVFFVKLQDDNCPVSGLTTIAYTIKVLPAPSITWSLNSPATCLGKASIHITPSGSGKPWIVKMSNTGSATDTFQVWTDSLAWDYMIAPGNYNLTVFTSVSNLCAVTIPVNIDRPSLSPNVGGVNPTYCGAADGKLLVTNLVVGGVDTVKYDWAGTPQPTVTQVADASGTVTIAGIAAGQVSNIIVAYGYCVSPPLGPVTLTNPPFTWSTLTSSNPTRCGYCDGKITVHGLHPGQFDSLFYTYNGSPVAVHQYVSVDSQILLSGLCKGSYSNFYAHTANGACVTSVLPGATLVAPTITANFDTVGIHYGCHGDSLIFTNQSVHVPADSILTYTWQYGDGATSNEVNPIHIYTNTATDTVFKVIMYMTNSKCISADSMTFTLRNYIKSGFSIDPNNYLCQGRPLTIVNNSTGGNPDLSVPIQYTWVYGDGATSATAAASHTHTFANTGNYNIMLIANNMIPCYDTAYAAIAIDSISGISISATDSVICRGQGITFSSILSSIGNNRNDSSIVWSFNDGTQFVNRNPVMHMYDADGTYTVTVNGIYRACPDNSITKQIRVFKQPDIDLGPDTAMCAGSAPITITDSHNANNSRARWTWNTDEYTSGITVAKPGQYTATVTIDGCSSSDTVVVSNDCYVSLPNVFSPNGDGVNDYFFPRQILTKGVVTFGMTIYNRWGQLIYETNSPDGRGWDGAMNSKPQPEGVYVYIIDAKFKDGQIEHHQGNVTLLR